MFLCVIDELRGDVKMEKKVLIVDDEKNIVDIIAFNLKKEGYEILKAADGFFFFFFWIL